VEIGSASHTLGIKQRHSASISTKPQMQREKAQRLLSLHHSKMYIENGRDGQI
jgi:hypothetical protein